MKKIFIKMELLFFSFVSLLFIFSSTCFAGKICGYVYDASSEDSTRISGVEVRPENGTITSTDPDGWYCLEFNTPSKKKITFIRTDYESKTITTQYIGTDDEINQNIGLKKDCPFSILTKPPFPEKCEIGKSFYHKISADCGIRPYNYYTSLSSLPPGLDLNEETGEITGEPEKTGEYSFKICAYDYLDAGNDPCMEYTINIYSKPVIKPVKLPSAIINKNYEEILYVDGGKDPFTFSYKSHNFGDDFTLDEFGKLSGIPKTKDPIYFTAIVQDAIGNVSEKRFDIAIVDELIIGPENINNWEVGKPVNQEFTLVGGSGNEKWFAKNLPKNIILNMNSGDLTGFPDSEFYDTIVIEARDSDGHKAFKEYNLFITQALKINNKDIYVNLLTENEEPYDIVIETSGGIKPYHYSSNNLPEWLELDEDKGFFRVFPNDSGNSNFNIEITITDSSIPQKELTETLYIKTERIFKIISSTNFPDLSVNKQVNEITLSAIGGRTPMKWFRKDGMLPTGISLSEDGKISGTPVKPGNYKCVIGVKDRNGEVTEEIFHFFVNEALSFDFYSLPDAYFDEYYEFYLKYKGGKGPYSVSLISGELPQGLVYDPETKKISGIPIEEKKISLTFQISDSIGSKIVQKEFLHINVENRSIKLSPEKIPNGKINNYYEINFDVEKGQPKYKWEIVSGFIPDGLTFTTEYYSATIKGIPEKQDEYNFSIRVSDNDNNVTTNSYTIIIFGKPEIENNILKDGIKCKKGYLDRIRVKNGEAPYVFELVDGCKLPDNLILDPNTGIISGDFTCDADSTTFKVKIHDSSQFQSEVQGEFFINVLDAPLKITTENIDDADLNLPYGFNLTANGGAMPYQWIIDGLPDGLTYNKETGVISGEPLKVGEYFLTANVQDSAKGSDTHGFTLSVKEDKYLISGYVNSDKENLSILMLLKQGDEEIARTMTDSDGYYQFSDVSIGEYKVWAASSFCEYDRNYRNAVVEYEDLQRNFEALCEIVPDNDNPSKPKDLTASIDTETWNNPDSITFSWTPSTDNTSQEISYLYSLDNNSSGLPDNNNISAESSITISNIIEGNDIYFYVQARDAAGNLSDISSIGPFYIDKTPPEKCRVYIKSKEGDNNVKVKLSAIDLGSGISKVQLSNNRYEWSEPFDWAEPSNDSKELNWKIIPGKKTIFAKFSDELDNSIIVRNDQARFIIIGGGENNPNNTYWEVTKQLTSAAYRDLLASGFDKNMIYYMINTKDIDINYDGIINEDDEGIVDDDYPESNDIINVISSEFVDDLNPDTPLFIYMQGHATSNGNFKLVGDINGNNKIDPESLKYSLDLLQSKVDCSVILIVESCYSGLFVEKLKNSEYKNRIIISSAGNVPYHTDSSGFISFSRFLFSKLREGSTLLKSFEYARNELINIGYPSPMLDDNSDGFFNNGSNDNLPVDGMLASNIYLNFPLLIWYRPEIIINQIIKINDSQAKVIFSIDEEPDLIKEINLQLIPSDSKISVDVPNNDDISLNTYEKIDFEYNDETNQYKAIIENYDNNLNYKIFAQARNIYNEDSIPLFEKLDNKYVLGDVNLDAIINLKDLILTLKAVSSFDDDNISKMGDLNNDNKIGIEEAIGLIRYLSE